MVIAGPGDEPDTADDPTIPTITDTDYPVSPYNTPDTNQPANDTDDDRGLIDINPFNPSTDLMGPGQTSSGTGAGPPLTETEAGRTTVDTNIVELLKESRPSDAPTNWGFGDDNAGDNPDTGGGLTGDDDTNIIDKTTDTVNDAVTPDVDVDTQPLAVAVAAIGILAVLAGLTA